MVSSEVLRLYREGRAVKYIQYATEASIEEIIWVVRSDKLTIVNDELCSMNVICEYIHNGKAPDHWKYGLLHNLKEQLERTSCFRVHTVYGALNYTEQCFIVDFRDTYSSQELARILNRTVEEVEF